MKKLSLKILSLIIAMSASAQTVVNYYETEKPIEDKIPALIQKIENIQFSNLSDSEKEEALASVLKKQLERTKRPTFFNSSKVDGHGEPGI